MQNPIALREGHVVPGENRVVFRVRNLDAEFDEQTMTKVAHCTHCKSALRPEANFCSHCGAKLRAMSRCASCERVVDVNDNFCDRCGTRLKVVEGLGVPDPVVTNPLSTVTRGITIEIDLPPAGIDPDLERLVRAQPSLEEMPAAEGSLARITFAAGEALDLITFVERTEGRRGRRVYRDGQRQTWDEFFRFLECFRSRRRSTNPSEYCFYDEVNNPNVWGCFQVGMPLAASIHGTEWLHTGTFENDGSFVFDKKRMIALLDQGLAPFRLCPALEVRHVGQALRALPVRVNPKLNKEWRYVEDAAGDDPNAVSALRREGGTAVEVRIRGVIPATPESAERIAQAVRRTVAGPATAAGTESAAAPELAPSSSAPAGTRPGGGA